MTTFYFIRHAETELNIQPHIIGGRSNHVGLTALGRAQAAAFGTWLAGSSIVPDAIYASPAVRTQHTAQLILQHGRLTLPVHTDDRLQELAQGVKEGADRKATYTQDVLARIANDPCNFKFQGGESVRDVQYRMSEVFADIAQTHPDETVFVISHGLAIRSLVGHIDNRSHHDIIRVLDTPNVSVTHITTVGDNATVHYTGRDLANLELLAPEQYT